MTASPEERRAALIRAMEPGVGRAGRHIENTAAAKDLDRLLAYFDEHEPAVADAIRYGGTPVTFRARDESHSYAGLQIHYPATHPKQ
jgi:hypothetical protein